MLPHWMEMYGAMHSSSFKKNEEHYVIYGSFSLAYIDYSRKILREYN